MGNICPDTAQEGIGGLGRRKKLAAFLHVTVIVDPVGQHGHLCHFKRAIHGSAVRRWRGQGCTLSRGGVLIGAMSDSNGGVLAGGIA